MQRNASRIFWQALPITGMSVVRWYRKTVIILRIQKFWYDIQTSSEVLPSKHAHGFKALVFAAHSICCDTLSAVTLRCLEDNMLTKTYAPCLKTRCKSKCKHAAVKTQVVICDCFQVLDVLQQAGVTQRDERLPTLFHVGSVGDDLLEYLQYAIRPEDASRILLRDVSARMGLSTWSEECCKELLPVKQITQDFQQPESPLPFEVGNLKFQVKFPQDPAGSETGACCTCHCQSNLLLQVPCCC